MEKKILYLKKYVVIKKTHIYYKKEAHKNIKRNIFSFGELKGSRIENKQKTSREHIKQLFSHYPNVLDFLNN